MKVIVKRAKCKKISIRYRGATAIVTAPYRTSVHQIQELLTSGTLANCDVNSYDTASSGLSHRQCVNAHGKHNEPLGAGNPDSASLEYKLLNVLSVAKNVLLGGHIYSVLPTDNTKPTFCGDKLHINSAKYYDTSLRSRAVKSFVKQYAESNLRASISKVGSDIGCCPSNIKLVALSVADWYDATRMVANNSIYIDYRVVQLPFVCQDRIIANCYNTILKQPLITHDYIDNICDEYLFVKKL